MRRIKNILTFTIKNMIELAPITLEYIEAWNLPIKHFSYSSMLEYLKNPRSFLTKYIRYQFDDDTGPALIMGNAVHKGLEVLFHTIRDTGEILPLFAEIEEDYQEEETPGHWVKKTRTFIDPTCILSIANEHAKRLIAESQGRALAKYASQNLDSSFEYPTFTGSLEDKEVYDLFEEVCRQIEDLVEDKDAVPAIIEGHKDDLIQWGGKKGSDPKKDMFNTIEITLQNYFDNFEADVKPFGVELSETVIFKDNDGVDMPVPLKVKIDRIDLDGDFVDITDYKTVAKFSDPALEKANFDLQAWASFFAAMVITGKIPRKFTFLEILKKKPGYTYPTDPESRLQKDDLIEIAADNEIMFPPKCLVAEMKQILQEEGILVQEKGVQKIEIVYADRPEVVDVTIAIYKGILNMLVLTDLYGCFLPNISEQYSGVSSWEDFKEFELTGKDWKDNIVVKTLAEPEYNDDNETF